MAAADASAYSTGRLVTTITDALGNETDYEYNNRHRVETVLQPDPDGGVVELVAHEAPHLGVEGRLLVVPDRLQDGRIGPELEPHRVQFLGHQLLEEGQGLRLIARARVDAVEPVADDMWLVRTTEEAELVVHYAPPVLLLRVRVMPLPSPNES